DVASYTSEAALREQRLAELRKSREADASLAAGLKAVEDVLDWRNWTVDKLELQLLKAKGVSLALPPDARSGFGKVLSLLNEMAESPAHRGVMRRLNVPKNVTVTRRN